MADNSEAVELTADIVSAYVSNNTVGTVELTQLIHQVHEALVRTAAGAQAEPAATLIPAVPIKKSVTPDYLISLEDGRKYKSLKRHLNTRGMSPDEYRTKWSLAKDYPMVAANYSAQRSSLAKTLGLGRGGRGGGAVTAPEEAPPEAAPTPEPEAAPATAKRSRRKAAPTS
jgi:predicted transcriptional regulator